MLNVLCVLKSGGPYDAEWVAKLNRGIDRNLKMPHRFMCLSDVEVPCERIALLHDWPGWYSKIEMFRKGVITGRTLYLDIDTVICGPLDDIYTTPHDFAMLKSFSAPNMVGSGVMWFKDAATVPHRVYEKFVKMPDCYIEHHARHADAATAYIGDQAFIWDALDRTVDTLDFAGLRSYKRHCRKTLPADTSIVCFHGSPRPPDVRTEWMQRHWA